MSILEGLNGDLSRLLFGARLLLEIFRGGSRLFDFMLGDGCLRCEAVFPFSSGSIFAQEEGTSSTQKQQNGRHDE